MKICKRCGSEFPINMLIDGKIRILNKRKYCLKCSPFGQHNTRILDMSSKDRRRRDKEHKNQVRIREFRKRRLVELMGGKCEICGYNKCLRNLCFHHIAEAEKTFDIASNLTTQTGANILNEVTQTVLLCCLCHGETHDGMHSDKVKLWKDSLGDRRDEFQREINLSEAERGYGYLNRKNKYNVSRELFKKECANCENIFETKIANAKYCSVKCSSLGQRKFKNRPSKVELEKLILEMPVTDIGKKKI